MQWQRYWREVLCTKDMLSRSWFEIIFYIESKKMDRHATENFWNVSAVSLFWPQKEQFFNVGDSPNMYFTSTVKKCTKTFKGKGTQNVKPFRYCLSFWRNQSKRFNAVKTHNDGSCFVQQNIQVMSLQIHKQLFFDKRHLHRAKNSTIQMHQLKTLNTTR